MNIFTVFFFILGLFFGSFYNVVGYRVPKNESIVKPGSHCPKCNKKLTPLELIPIFSFIIQKGKCKSCKEQISWFYPTIELFTGVLFATSYYSFGFSYELGISLVLSSYLSLVIVSDVNYMIIPDSFTIITALSIIIIKLFGVGLKETGISILYGLITFAIMYGIMLVGKALFKKESLGGGDVKLMFNAGLVLHPILGTFSIFLGSVIALPISIYLYIKNHEKMIPFGPFLVIGIMIIFFLKIDIQELKNILNLI